MRELISKDILAILPTYIEGEGNCTIDAEASWIYPFLHLQQE